MPVTWSPRSFAARTATSSTRSSPSTSSVATCPEKRSGCPGIADAPSRIERVVLSGPREEGTLEARVRSHSPEGPFDVVVVDGDGAVRTALEGYATATLPVDLPEAQRAPLRDALGPEATK